MNLEELLQQLEALTRRVNELQAQLDAARSDGDDDPENEEPEFNKVDFMDFYSGEFDITSREDKLEVIEEFDTNSRNDVFEIGGLSLTESDGIEALTETEVDNVVDEVSDRELETFADENSGPLTVVSTTVSDDSDNVETRDEQEDDLEGSVTIGSNHPGGGINPTGPVFLTEDGTRARQFSFTDEDGDKQTFTAGTEFREFSEFDVRIRSREEINERLEDFKPNTTSNSRGLYGEDFDNDKIYETTGTDFKDVWFGDDRKDVFRGGEGDDKLLSGRGDDVLYGGKGNDSLYGSRGEDVLVPGEGDFFDFANDTIETGERFSDHMDLVNGGDTTKEHAHDTAILRGTLSDWTIKPDERFDDNDFVNAQSNSLEHSVKLIGIEEVQFTNSNESVDVLAL